MNPAPFAQFAGRAEYPEDWNRPSEVLFTVGYQESTNNRMELMASITALEHVCDNVLGVQTVQIVTDSLCDRLTLRLQRKRQRKHMVDGLNPQPM